MLSTISNAIKMSWQRAKDQNALPFFQQLKEMLLLQIKTGFGPGNYHKYRLWQNDMPWQQKLGYWHDQKYYRFLNKVNPLSYRTMARNKVIAKALLRFYDIPDAEYLAFLSGNEGFLANGQPINTLDDLSYMLHLRSDLTKICFKPVTGSGGDGFCAVEIVRDNGGIKLRQLSKDKSLNVNDFVTQLMTANNGNDFIIEKYLEQHPALAAFNPSSLNTLRVWVGKKENEKAKVIAIYLRIGRQGSMVDNLLSGGFGIPIDPADFKTTLAMSLDSSKPSVKIHPDSGFNMFDRLLPFREEVIALSEKTISVLPHTTFVGLDIALTPERPVIVEFNLAPTAIGAYVINSSHQQLLGWLEHDS
jgi:hypothetical protein